MLQIRLLGGFAVQIADTPVPDGAWRLRKAKDVVKLLALAPGHHLHREQVMEHLWPERAPEAAANNLHQALHVARRALRRAGGADDLLRLREGQLQLSPGRDPWIDLTAYEVAAKQARSTNSLDEFRRARSLYGGELLPDDRYEDWVGERREALAQDHLVLLSELASLEEASGDPAGAVETLRELVALDPLHEEGRRELMRLYVLGGQHRLALRQFESLRAALQRDLDIEPAEETQRLHREILEGKVAAAALGPTVAVPGARPGRLRMPSAPAHNLPVQLSSFIGRDREIDDIHKLFAGTRLLSLTGAGGCGKTRLAIEAAASSRRDFVDGVWFVALAALGQPSLVIQAIAEVFEVREQEGTPLVEAVAGYLRDRNLLLILDNCEHLVDACAHVTQALLSVCPELRVMTTSRQPLRIPGEVVFRVPSLELPDPVGGSEPGDLRDIASVRLFTERAQAISPGFALGADNALDVARLCFHLDGLPLAIELAASRVATLPIAAIAGRLGDRFRLLVGGSRTAISRQQTLIAALDWSYQLLTEPERAVLRRLAIFLGGISLEAAEDVCAGPDVDRSAVLGLIGELVDKSLVVPDEQDREARFRLLETVREYGLEQLVEVGERPAAEVRHAQWFLGLVKVAREALPKPDRGEWLQRVELEHDNVRAAFDRSLTANPCDALRLAACMWQFWLWRAYLTEGRRRIGQALERCADRSEDRAEALLGLGALAIRSAAVPEGRRTVEECRELAEHLGATSIGCRALMVVGVAAWSQDDLGPSRAAFEQGLEIATETGFEPCRAIATHNLGLLEHMTSPDTANELIEKSIVALRSLADTEELAPPMLDVGEFIVPGFKPGGMRVVWQETFSRFQDVPCRTALGHALANRAMLARTDGDLDLAHARMEESLELFEEIGDERAIGQALTRLGNLAVAEVDLVRARELLEQAFELRRRIGDWRGMMMTQLGLGNLAVAEGHPEEADRLLEDAAATFRRRGDNWGYTGATIDVANLALARSDPVEARRRIEESIAAIRISGRTRWLGWANLHLGEVARLEGDEEAVRGAVADAREIFERIGDRLGIERSRALLEERPAR